jgi:hypothetical protein
MKGRRPEQPVGPRCTYEEAPGETAERLGENELPPGSMGKQLVVLEKRLRLDAKRLVVLEEQPGSMRKRLGQMKKPLL